jgi:hypothetical protein
MLITEHLSFHSLTCEVVTEGKTCPGPGTLWDLFHPLQCGLRMPTSAVRMGLTDKITPTVPLDWTAIRVGHTEGLTTGTRTHSDAVQQA